MKKIICLLGVTLLLSACSIDEGVADIEAVEQPITIEMKRNKSMYIRDEVKEVIEEINSLREKYKYEIVDDVYNDVFVNIYEEDNTQRIKVIEFNNRYILNDEYFDDIVRILDESLAEGLKGYADEMRNKELKIDEPIVKKIGRAVVYTENRGDEKNYISIIMNFSEIEDEDYREIFNKISQDEYILDHVIVGEKLNLIDFGNPNISQYIGGRGFNEDLIIRYNVFFKDRDIEKVNILLKGKSEADLKEEDIDVFINMLNTLELNGEDKGVLIKEYKNILSNKKNSKKISLEGYSVFIKYNKGSIYGRKDWEHIYFSIEKD